MGMRATAGPTTRPDAPARGGRRSQLLFLDSIRALAALSVAVDHCYDFASSTDSRGFGHGVGRLLSIGQLGVPVFIVLSGFVLMLPVARTRALDLRGGFIG